MVMTMKNSAGTMNDSAGTGRRIFALICLVPLVVFGASSCATPQEEEVSTTQPGNAGDTENDDGTTDDDALESLDSTELLDLGMAGDAVITCDFARGKVVGTIYFGGLDRQRFDGVNPNGVSSHILNHEGRAHAWNDSQSEGARYPRPEEVTWLVGEDPADVRAHSTNCVPHSDLSVFKLPDGITFTDMPAA